jgi:hypothetical protein
MKTKTVCKIVLLAVFSALVLTSCNKDKEVNENTPSQGSFSCKIDGVPFTATSFNNTLIGDVSGKRLDIRATDATGKQIIVTVNDLDVLGTNFSHLGDSVFVDVFENDPVGLASVGTLMYTDNSYAMTEMDGGKDAGFVKLNSSDLSSKKVSGVFAFQIYNYVTDETINITDGVFTNVVYTQYQ